jgi:hypothetical protein
MILDLKSIFLNEKTDLTFDYMLDLKSFELSHEEFPFKKPIRVFGKVSQKTGITTLNGAAEFDIFTKCDRCLKEITEHYNITFENLSDNIKTYTVYGVNPVFLWSPDSKFLAVTYTGTNGQRWTQIEILENSMGMAVPAKSKIQDLYNETKTTDISYDNATITVTEWLDKSHALVKFSWPSDTQGKTISGWLTCEFPSGTIKDFHMTQ